MQPSPKTGGDTRNIVVAVGSLVGLVASVAWLGLKPVPCMSAWMKWRMYADVCPAGTPLPRARMVVRTQGAEASTRVLRVELTATAVFPDQTNRLFEAPLGASQPTLELVDADGMATPLAGEWTDEDGVHHAVVELPKLPDGDFLIRGGVDTRLGGAVVESPVSFFAPAVAHVLTDRPLFQPGQTIQVRGLALSADGLTPLEGRPGKVSVLSPAGELLMEERLQTGDMGVVATDFPLSANAPSGRYTVRWQSGAASDEVEVRVEPYTLPRVEVELSGGARWYGVGDRPSVRGMVRYRSGAPVADAMVEVSLTGSGSRWPLPLDWQATQTVRTDAEGRFERPLAPVPADLDGHGAVQVDVSVVATDPAGERTSGGGRLVLSADPIIAQLETELDSGLAADFNNRIYLRLTTPDGVPVPQAELTVSSAWDAHDPGVQAVTDADGVAALQLDPGQPVTLVRPPLPVRSLGEDGPSEVQVSGLVDLFTGDPATLHDRLAFAALASSVRTCAVLPQGRFALPTVGVLVDATGAVARVLPDDTLVGACVARQVARELRLQPGHKRLLRVNWRLERASGAELDEIDLSAVPELSEGVEDSLLAARLVARGCVIDETEAAPLAAVLHWRVRQGHQGIETDWIPTASASDGLGGEALACVVDAFSDLSLSRPADHAADGVLRLAVVPGSRRGAAARSEQVLSGFRLAISATAQGSSLGRTTLDALPGEVPALRLRPERSVLAAGDPIQVAVLRGPAFTGVLPPDDQDVDLRHASGTVATLRWSSADRQLTGAVPDGVNGLLWLDFEGVRSVMYVPVPARLSVDVSSERAAYRPGETAQLTVTTRAGGQPRPAWRAGPRSAARGSRSAWPG